MKPSLFGVTAKFHVPQEHGFPTASLDQKVPFGGLYGAGKFGYSMKDYQSDTTQSASE
jgi:hypothetical protein